MKEFTPSNCDWINPQPRATEEKEFDITISHTMSVMAESYEDAVEWVKNHVATQGRHIDFDIE